MKEKVDFKDRYETGDTPWDLGKADFNLIRTITDRLIEKRDVLDIGCGRGDAVVWLAQQNFKATGCDLSELAVREAEKKASEAGVECDFAALDFLKDEIPNAPFDLAFDRGCFHCFDQVEERKLFAEKLSANLKENGLWLSLIGNADDDRPRGNGPPRLTAADIIAAVEPFFQILSLESGYFDSTHSPVPKAWICLSRKRK